MIIRREVSGVRSTISDIPDNMSEISKISELFSDFFCGRRSVLVAVTALLLAFSVCVHAQQNPGLPRIGWVGSRSEDSPGSGRESFKQEFRKLGYIDGKNVTLEFRSAAGKLDRLPAIADHLVRVNVAV